MPQLRLFCFDSQFMIILSSHPTLTPYDMVVNIRATSFNIKISMYRVYRVYSWISYDSHKRGLFP
jgi:hypothetical protein